MTLYTWSDTVDDIRSAKTGDLCVYRVKSDSEIYRSEVVSNGSNADSLKVKALPYSKSQEDVAVKDDFVVAIIRTFNYDVPDDPGLYFDKNDALYYQSDKHEWWFIYQPHDWYRNIPQVTKFKFDDLDPMYFPFRKAKAVQA